MRRPFLPPIVLALCFAAPASLAGAAVTVEVAQELRQGGNNYDDPCFWQDPTDPGAALACITSKDDQVVECFALPSGTFAGIAGGFPGRPNNCDVDAARNELLTTDKLANRVLVHQLPGLGSPLRILEAPDSVTVSGICVAHADGHSLAFVTDELAQMVFVIDSASGQLVRSFPHDLPQTEGIACDEGRQRIYICDDNSDARACRAFTFDGKPIPPEFGIAETGSDAEGVALYTCGPHDGYIIVADQSFDEFEVFERSEPFGHLCTFRLVQGGDATTGTDGIDVVQIPAFPNGMFGACDGCKGSGNELDLVPWESIAHACGLAICPLGVAPDQPVCGDGMINGPSEECDGASDGRCPGLCRADCTCPPPANPTCGDDVVNQPTEACDGRADAVCPGRCNARCQCGPVPRCGDGAINQAGEECDRWDDASCPGQCGTDCRCPVLGAPPVAVILADVTVRKGSRRNLDGRKLDVDARTEKRALLRIGVTGVGTRVVTRALLHLTVANTSSAASNHGGQAYGTSCDWDEATVTWRTRPAIETAMVDEHPDPVVHGEQVTFDLTGFITGDGEYCVVFTSPSTNGVSYASREMLMGPWVETTAGGPRTPSCGDGVVDPPDEQCDGTADQACPGRCQPDCQCGAPPVCGDGVVDPPDEQCDGTADQVCPGRCQPDCQCGASPVCGDGVVDPPDEQCDGSDDVLCRGRCRADCTCPPPDDDDTLSCLASGADLVLSGTFTEDYHTRSLAPDSVIDATAATFVHCSQPDPSSPCSLNIYPVNLGPTEGTGICWSGGLVVGANRLDATWSEMHDPNNAGFIFENAASTVEGLRMHNVGDGIRPRSGAQDFLIKDVWLSYIRDDCVENDGLYQGIVDDSLFDGCFVGFSARHPDLAKDGSQNVWTIQNSLVRLEAMPGPPGGGSSGHKGFFKWIDWGDPNSRSPKLALYNNIFMAEGEGQLSSERMGIPPGKVVDCTNNIMVWLGPGDYPAALPACFTVVKDVSVWDEARAQWIARHPGVRRP